MNLDLTGLADMNRPAAGEPLMLSLDLISRDINQPRKYFDEEKLKELAESIRAIGVVQPISVRPDPDSPGRYIINYGERRFLAALIAGLLSIPVFVHKAPDDYTQVAENLHHADLSPMEIAVFIKRRLDIGEKKYEIAAKLGYKNGYVTEHLALLEAPPCVEKAYANGATSARTLYDLRRLHDEFPEEVDAWCSSGVEVTRDTVAALAQKFRRDEILDGASAAHAASAVVGADDAPEQPPIHKFRRDEILGGGLATHTPSNAIASADVSAQPPNKNLASGIQTLAAAAASTRPERERRIACVRQSKPESARLFIKVGHDGRVGTLQEDSVVLVRYDDGGTAEVSLAKLVVLGTVAE